MASTNSTVTYDCINTSAATIPIVLAIFTLPLQLHLIKIIARDVRFSLPRHTILFSLTLSDAILVSGFFIIGLVTKVTTLAAQSIGCKVSRVFGIVIFSSTTTISCLSIAAMSMERYISCVHSFHIHKILTETRLRFGSIFVWALGIIAGSVAITTMRYDAESIVNIPSEIQYTVSVAILGSSIPVVIIQTRLFLFSREKINQEPPVTTFGEDLERFHYVKMGEWPSG